MALQQGAVLFGAPKPGVSGTNGGCMFGVLPIFREGLGLLRGK